MAYREVHGVEIQEIIRRWQAGLSQRRIASGTGLSRVTVRRYVEAAEAAGLTPGGPEPSEEQLAALATLSLSGPRQVEAPSEELLSPWAEQIERWLETDRLQLTRIQELLAGRGCEVSYTTLRRFIRRRGWRHRLPSTVRMDDGPPGEVVAEARRRRLLSADHFTVDGTLLEAWASLKSYRPRDDQDPPSGGGRNPEVDFRGQRRRSDTHASTTDPEARLYRKGRGQKAALSYMGHLLTENRHGLVVDVELTEAHGRAEREAAVAMVERSTTGRATLGADRGYDTRDFVAQLRSRGVTPHVAVNDRRWGHGAIDGRTTRHDGYALSQRRRKRVEEVFGWIKTVGGGRKLRYVGASTNRFWLELNASAYNLVRIARLEVAAA